MMNGFKLLALLVVVAFVYESNAAPIAIEPVQVTLLYESKSRTSKIFFERQFYPTYKKLAKYMNVTLVPFGSDKFHLVDKKVFKTCQHGEEECFANKVQSCATELYGIDQAIDFTNCHLKNLTQLKECAETYLLGKDTHDKLEFCANSSVGYDLNHKAMIRTEFFEPEPKYLPWFTINGVHTEELYHNSFKNFEKVICDNIEGSKPASCIWNNYQQMPSMQFEEGII